MNLILMTIDYISIKVKNIHKKNQRFIDSLVDVSDNS